MAEVNTVPR